MIARHLNRSSPTGAAEQFAGGSASSSLSSCLRMFVFGVCVGMEWSKSARDWEGKMMFNYSYFCYPSKGLGHGFLWLFGVETK